MSSQKTFTTTTPLPHDVPPKTAISKLQSHTEMIKLNPLVVDFEPCSPHADAPPDELNWAWYQITDKIDYLPYGLFSSQISYKASFHNLPTGLQTHVYAPLGVDIQESWTVSSSRGGDSGEEVEGTGEGLFYLNEDVHLRCHLLMKWFVMGSMKKAHHTLVQHLVSN